MRLKFKRTLKTSQVDIAEFLAAVISKDIEKNSNIEYTALPKPEWSGGWQGEEDE